MATRPTYEPARVIDKAPAAKLLELIAARWISEAIHVAAILGIADLLAHGPKTAEQLAKATGSHADSLYRVMRALASVGVFAQEGGAFGLTPVSEFLCDGIPGSMRAPAIYFGGENSAVDGVLAHCVETGETAYRKLFGADSRDLYRRNPELSRAFDETASAFSALHLSGVVRAYDFSAVAMIVEVGGGAAIIKSILAAYLRMRGIVFDSPAAFAASRTAVAEAGLRSRCQVIQGDYFDYVPEGADAYVLPRVIRDWDDESAIALLKVIREAVPTSGKLLLVEAPVAPGNLPSCSKLIDLDMLLRTGGRERTQAEYRTLLEASGFKLTKVVPTESPTGVAIIEGRPAE
jgi:nucleotide-binding universal stress UspA family protein